MINFYIENNKDLIIQGNTEGKEITIKFFRSEEKRTAWTEKECKLIPQKLP